MVCISSSKFSFSINGILEGNMIGKQGLRQGDPLSPYLFVFCMDYLDRLFKARIPHMPAFKFHPKCKKIGLCHMVFVDDLLLFCRGDSDSMAVLKAVVDEFSLASSLKINMGKSTIFCAGVTDEAKRDIKSIWGFQEGFFPIRYLGGPLSPRRLYVNDYDPLISSMLRRIQGWQGGHLSYAGRLQLVKAILFSIQNFWAQFLFFLLL